MESKQRTAPSIPRPKKLSRTRTPEKKISPLGRKLALIRHEIEASGFPMLTDKEIARELNERRGGAYAH